MGKKPTIKSHVVAAADQLRELGYADLFRWAKAHGFDNAASFGAFKRSLAGIDIDYDVLRTTELAERHTSLLAAASASLRLYSAGDAEKCRYAVTDAHGTPLWAGESHGGGGHMDAALKAVWLAGKVREQLGYEAIRLELIVSAEWLRWANAVGEGDKRGGKARKIGRIALKYSIALHVVHVADADNLAVEVALAEKVQDWNTVDLSSLAC